VVHPRRTGQTRIRAAGKDVSVAIRAPTAEPSGLQPARPQLLRALNEQLLLQHIRNVGPCSRA